MNIGFLHPNNLLSVDVTTLLKQFVKDGHKVVLITISQKGHIHEVLENTGIIFEFIDYGKPKNACPKVLTARL